MVVAMVAPAVITSALPSRVVGMVFPAVPNVIDASEIMVPTIAEPVLIVAPPGTYQKTFLALAPFVSRTALPFTVSVPGTPSAVWNTQTALGLPPPSSVRSLPDIW